MNYIKYFTPRKSAINQTSDAAMDWLSSMFRWYSKGGRWLKTDRKKQIAHHCSTFEIGRREMFGRRTSLTPGPEMASTACCPLSCWPTMTMNSAPRWWRRRCCFGSVRNASRRQWYGYIVRVAYKSLVKSGMNIEVDAKRLKGQPKQRPTRRVI